MKTGHFSKSSLQILCNLYHISDEILHRLGKKPQVHMEAQNSQSSPGQTEQCWRWDARPPDTLESSQQNQHGADTDGRWTNGVEDSIKKPTVYTHPILDKEGKAQISTSCARKQFHMEHYTSHPVQNSIPNEMCLTVAPETTGGKHSKGTTFNIRNELSKGDSNIPESNTKK